LQRNLAPNKTSRATRHVANEALEIARLGRELNEAREHQAATAGVLRMISRFPNDVQSVLEAILRVAGELCEAEYALLFRLRDIKYHVVCSNNAAAEYVRYFAENPISMDKGSLIGRTVLARQTVHIEDCLADPEYKLHAAARLGRHRTMLGVPLMHEGEVLGVISLLRTVVKPFTEKQIELVTAFADEAVIAIENTRLLNELRQRTTDLAESLEQQTATSKVLAAISSSPGDLKPVFEAILQNAVRLCGAKFGNLYLREGDGFRAAAMHNAPAAYAEQRAGVVRPSPSSTIWQAAQSKRPAQTADMKKLQAYAEGDPWIISTISLGGYRSVLSVPMLHKDEVIGGVTIFRQEAGTFAERQIELLTNFAKQAVIAIENARLLRELRERTDQLAAQSQELAALNQQLEQRVSDQVGEIERMGRLRRFLPPQVADLIVASGSEKQLESHRREITALFCDLRGFTGFSESSDPEDVMALLRDYHAAIGEIIIKHTGTLERYAGDGVMVVFNDPVPLENPALQAVLMALEMRDAIGVLTERWRRLGHEIGFGIGVAHGFATLGTIGFEGRFDYAAIGTVSNIASRLCDEAKPGQILISPRVLMNVENAVQVEPIGEFTLKGIRRPLAAYNVLSANSAN
jgi:class 3 adenylate cyclase